MRSVTGTMHTAITVYSCECISKSCKSAMLSKPVPCNEVCHGDVEVLEHVSHGNVVHVHVAAFGGMSACVFHVGGAESAYVSRVGVVVHILAVAAAGTVSLTSDCK